MVREGGLVAFITSQGVLNAEQGRPVREWLMNRCEPVIGHPAARTTSLQNTRGRRSACDLVILQKKAATGELSERQRDFIESRKLSNGIRINNLFQSYRQGDPYRGQSRQRPLRQTGDGVHTTRRAWTASTGRCGRMLSEDFNRHFNESYCLEHAPEQTPGTPERELSRPRQANASVPKDTSPALPEKSSRRLSPTPVTFSSNGKRRKNAASSPKWRRRATKSIPKPGELPESKTNPDKRYRILPPLPPENRPGRIWPTSGPGSKRAGESLVGAAPAETRRFRHDGYTVQHVAEQRNRNRGRASPGRFSTRWKRRLPHLPPQLPNRKRAAGTVADALRSVRLQRRGAAAGRTRYIQEKEQPPGAKRKTPDNPH